MNDTPASDTKGQDPLIGRVINDRYKIVSVIARGGMGKVYLAEQAPLGRKVALKVLNPNYQGDADPDFHRRFFLEASTSAKLTHPNTVTVFDYGRTDDEVYYIAMELLEGRTLHKAIRDDAPMSPRRAVHIARQICRSLREAHGLGVIHRDLKPANVYLVEHGDEKDFVKVLDFGLVKDLEKEGEDLTQTGLFMGSPKYMSPEQIRGEKVDARTDVYALGVILYEMMTGKVPFDRANSVNILMAHVHENAPPMGVMLPGAAFPPELEAFVFKAMAKKAEDRYTTMDEVLNAIRDLPAEALTVTRSAEHLLTSSHSGSTPLDVTDVPTTMGMTASSSFTGSVLGPAPTQKSRSNGMAIAAIAILALGIGGLAFALFARNPRPEPAPARAPVTEPTPAVAAATPPPGAEPITVVRVQLRSTPSGASVLIGDQPIATTPADLEWTGEDARAGRSVTFTFRLAGYRDYTVMRSIHSDSIAIDALLEPAPATVRRAPTPHAREPGGSDRARGFHLNPY